jgi:hypothetical protein
VSFKQETPVQTGIRSCIWYLVAAFCFCQYLVSLRGMKELGFSCSLGFGFLDMQASGGEGVYFTRS